MLGELMKRSKEDPGPSDGIPAGYTYFGQFIDHDLTFDITPLARAQPCAERTPNFRSPILDLDQLYGGGPTVSPFLYQRGYQYRGKEHFLIGNTVLPDGKKGPDGDLPRNPEGVALVGDPREDENLIIAQLHVVFLKFHNRVIEGLEKGSSSSLQSVGPNGGTLFEQARRLVIWTYQYIVINDFLSLLMDKQILNRMVEPRAERDKSGSKPFLIPIEFSVAAFRFGHTMVRDFYILNKAHENPPASLADLLFHTGMAGGIQNTLGNEWVISWENFFYLGNPPRYNSAQTIKTKVAAGLHDLPPEVLRLFSASIGARKRQAELSACPGPNANLPLPVRTLLRGARMGLPSGQDIAKAIGVPDSGVPDFLTAPSEQVAVLEEYKLLNDTPLWYYILKEAEQPPRRGKYLGPVGSHIVATVIVGALRADQNSYLSIDPNWTPAFRQMSEIINFVNP